MLQRKEPLSQFIGEKGEVWLYRGLDLHKFSTQNSLRYIFVVTITVYKLRIGWVVELTRQVASIL